MGGISVLAGAYPSPSEEGTLVLENPQQGPRDWDTPEGTLDQRLGTPRIDMGPETGIPPERTWNQSLGNCWSETTSYSVHLNATRSVLQKKLEIIKYVISQENGPIAPT